MPDLPKVLESNNMKLIGYNGLGDLGDCGEGVALQIKNGRRYLYVAHLFAWGDFSVLDVTDPRDPKLICQTRLPHKEMRSNSLMIVGDVLAVARQVNKLGEKPAGVELFDVSDPANPKSISFFDTSGPMSPGCHFLWFIDGEYIYCSSGTSDFDPISPKEAWQVVIIDVRNPSKPIEAGRWHLPGTAKSDPEAKDYKYHSEQVAEWLNVDLPPREQRGFRPVVGGIQTFDVGSRVHDVYVYPQRPDRCYVGYLDSGAIILDIKDKAHPKQVARLDYHPPAPGHTHTVMPIFSKNLLAITEESLTDDCLDHPKLLRFADMSFEPNLQLVSSAPLPDKDRFCGKGRFGAHNIYDNPPVPGSWISEDIIVGCFFSAGVRAFDIRNPMRPEEIAYLIPDAPEGLPAIQMNDLHIDENGTIFAIDRVKGGLYVMESNF